MPLLQVGRTVVGDPSFSLSIFPDQNLQGKVDGAAGGRQHHGSACLWAPEIQWLGWTHFQSRFFCFSAVVDQREQGNSLRLQNPLELLDKATLTRIPAKRSLKGKVFTPYYGCVLLRPEGTAIRNKHIMEEMITFFGGEIEGERIKDRCCGGNQFFANKWATERLSTLILEKSKGPLVVFCPLCHMALKTFSTGAPVIYLTELVLYIMGENRTL